ncbi:hypothetical protein MHU86_18711 [Fragilaria crotonensis]|nr:hypothetical protein MHU86_18711 [Fragilaria crotonensis]
MALALLKGSARDKSSKRGVDSIRRTSGSRTTEEDSNEIFQLVMTEVEGKAEPSKLSDDHLIQILNQAKPEEWQAVILGANIELYKFDFQGTVDYFEKLELRQALEAKRRKVDKPITLRARKGQLERSSLTLSLSAFHATRSLASVRSATLHPRIDAEIVEMFSPKTTISTVETKEDSDESSIYFGSFSSEILPSKDGHGSKRQKQKHKTTEVVGEVMEQANPALFAFC